MNELDLKEVFSRQVYMFKPELFVKPVTVLGAGFVGSNLAFSLLKTGFKSLFLIDNDVVKDHNLTNQFYTVNDLGQYKVDALKNHLSNLISTKPVIFSIRKKFEEYLDTHMNILNNGVVVVSIDSKDGRSNLSKLILDNWDKCKNTTFIWVNTSSDLLYIGITKGDKKFIENIHRIFTNLREEQTTAGICGEKSAFYLGSLCSGFVITELRKWFKPGTEEKESQSLEILYDIHEGAIVPNFKWFNK